MTDWQVTFTYLECILSAREQNGEERGWRGEGRMARRGDGEGEERRKIKRNITKEKPGDALILFRYQEGIGWYSWEQVEAMAKTLNIQHHDLFFSSSFYIYILLLFKYNYLLFYLIR